MSNSFSRGPLRLVHEAPARWAGAGCGDHRSLPVIRWVTLADPILSLALCFRTCHMGCKWYSPCRASVRTK